MQPESIVKIADWDNPSTGLSITQLGAVGAAATYLVDENGDPITGIGGGGAGTQYTEEDTDASITGTVTMMEAAGNTLVPIQGSVADGLLVNLGSNNDIRIQADADDYFKWSFAKVVSNNVDTTLGTLLQTGSGMTINQSNGNLVITTGTTAYSESVIRSLQAFSGPIVMRYGLTLSQRIAQNNFAVELVDVIGDGLALTINGTTSVSVTKTNHGFTAQDIGKGMWIGLCSVANCLTQRAVIASLPDANTINLTVAGFPASGSGTCSLFGYNFYQVIYSGTTATALGTGFNTQRYGWANTANNATISTTASGHIGVIETARNIDASYADYTQGTAATVQATPRAVMSQNIPDRSVELYLQIRAYNGSSNPASGTTLTIGFVDIQSYDNLMVNISGMQPMSSKNNFPVTITSGTITTVTTVTTVSTVTNITNQGHLADDAAFTPGTTRVMMAGFTADETATDSVDEGDAGAARMTLDRKVITTVQPHTQGGLTIYRLLAAASTNGNNIKNAAGQVYGWYLYNNTASVKFVKLYDKSSAPTVGTDTPVMTIPLPANGGANVHYSMGVAFASGIGIGITGAIADNDTTAVSANDVIVNLFYK